MPSTVTPSTTWRSARATAPRWMRPRVAKLLAVPQAELAGDRAGVGAGGVGVPVGPPGGPAVEAAAGDGALMTPSMNLRQICSRCNK